LSRSLQTYMSFSQLERNDRNNLVNSLILCYNLLHYEIWQVEVGDEKDCTDGSCVMKNDKY
jgi:hypothetical protein